MKRVFIIHGWDGHPEEGVFPWLKEELEKKGFKVVVPAMPEPLNPQIDSWASFLRDQIGSPDTDTFLFGHSIGSQTILRYLQSLDEGQQIGGAVFLAGWVNLTDEAYETEEDVVIAQPWLETPLDWPRIKSKIGKTIAIFSEDDPLVPLSDSEIFEKELDAKIVIEKDKGHFSGSSGIKELSSALSAVLEISND